MYLVHQFGNRTGVELHTELLAAGLRSRYDTFVVWPEGNTLQLLHGNLLSTFPADPIAWPEAPMHAGRTERSLAEIIRFVQPSLIHIQHFLNWPLSLIDQAVDTGTPVIVSFHDHFALSPLYALPPDDTLSPAWAIQTFGRDISPWLRSRREHLQRCLARAQALVTVSPYLERQLAAVFPAAYRQIEYGIVGFDRLPRIASTNLRFGFLGQLVPMKGWQSLVRAFAQVRDHHASVELDVWGGAPDTDAPGVSFHGGYTAADLPAICARLDVGVVPSIFAETYCMVLSEMWRGGLPVAVSDIGAMHDRVVDGVNGWKFKPGDPDSIAGVLSWFVENQSWRSWRLPEPRLADAMVCDYDALYQEVLGSARRRSCADRDLLIVQVCGFLDEGDGVYRLHSPSAALSRLPGVTVIECHPQHRRLPELMEAADVLILASLDWDVFGLIPRRRAAGKVTLFEANDYYPDIQPWNPLSTRWLERALHDWLRHSLQQADGIQTSTPELARRWRQRTDRPIGVFANQLPAIPPLAPPPARPLTIGWGGSRGHLNDWQKIAPALQSWLDAHPDVHLAVMTDDRARAFFRLRPDRYHFQPLGSLADYLAFLERLDIGLAPLLPTDFNRCRSDVKFLEYASRGVVGIYANLEPYRDSIVHGQTGFLYSSEAELFMYLDTLLGDVSLRHRMRAAAYEQVAQQRRLDDHVAARLAFYRELLRNCGPASPRRMAFTTDRAHLQMQPEEPEAILLAAVEGPPTADTVTTLERLVRQYPDYLAARQELGAMYNDLGQPAAALAHLEHAAQLAPERARTLAEMARARHRLGNSAEARRLLERAIELNPYSPLPWRYLLRLLASGRGGAVDLVWAERAREFHPANYGLALLAVPLYPFAEALALLRALLDRYAPGLHPSERPTAAAAFAAAIADVTGSRLDCAEAAQLVRHARTIFPRSPRLAELAARVSELERQ